MKKILKKLPFVPTIYRNIRESRFARKEPAMTPFGFKMIGSDLMQKGEFEPGDTKIFRRLIKDADVLVDVGAHFGYYCLQALGLGKKIIAFEPMPTNAKLLMKNIALNGLGERAEIFQMALADKPGILEMYGGGMGASLVKGWGGFSSKSPTLVPVSSLDLVIGDRLAGQQVFILIDVEGAEYRLLQGAKKMLNEDPRPIWMVEITYTTHQPGERGGHNPHYLDTFKLFWEAGYDAYSADEQGNLRLLDKKMFNDLASAEKQIFSNLAFIHKTRTLS